jgi:hypothetical protein
MAGITLSIITLLVLFCYSNALVRHSIARRAVGLTRLLVEKRPNTNSAPKASGPTVKSKDTTKSRGTGAKKSTSRDPDYNPLVMYNEDLIKPWSFSDSFNSTTLKFIFEIKVMFSYEASHFVAKDLMEC